MRKAVIHVTRALESLLLAAMVGSLSLQFTGCTAIGYGVGAFIDSRGSHRLRQVEARKRFALENGVRVRLVLRDGSDVRGRYAGLVRVAAASYADRYEAWRAGQGDAAPRIGEEVRIERANGHVRRAEFAGFDNAGVSVRGGNPNRPPVVAWEELAALTSPRGTLTGDELRVARDAGALPLAVMLAVRTPDGARRLVDPQDVAGVDATPPQHAAIYGATLGLTADIVVLIVTIRPPTVQQQPDCGGQSPSGGLF